MVKKREQKSIGLTLSEKARLEKAKRLYEESTGGDKTDWGQFLGIIAGLGLAALGVYHLTKSTRENPVVTCAVCKRKFPIAYSEDLPPIVYVSCPYCSSSLVVDFREP
jgi:DNA-directed RNA polymerase subunit RPC12/RpoP